MTILLCSKDHKCFKRVEEAFVGANHLHPHVEAFCDGQVEFLGNASTEALPTRSECAGWRCYRFIDRNWELYDLTANHA